MFLEYVGSLTLVIHTHNLLYIDLKDILHLHIQSIVALTPLSKIDPY